MSIKNLLLTWGISFVLSQAVSAQGSLAAQPADTADYPYWVKMMQDPDANFYATQHAFNKYWENRLVTKGSGWKPFKRWEYINESRVLPDGKLPAPDYVKNQYFDYVDSHPERSVSGNWSQIGPIAIPANATGQPNGMGRLNGICFHPTDANTFYVGSPSGGIWKTSNGGSTWTNLSGSMPTLGASAILVHPSSPNTIWIGTGDRDHGDAPGMGVYKSTNGGITWNVSNTGMGNRTIGMMIMHPTNANIILAAANGGIYKSIDGGATWTLKSGSGVFFKDIKFKPGDPTVVYASEGGKFYRSTNTGDSWTQITSGIITGNRMVIGVSANNPNYVYLIQTNGPFVGCMRSTNSGVSFVTRSTTPNIMDYSCDGSGTSSQAWYDLCIAVDPNNAEIFYVGGVNTWKSTNGGSSFTINAHWVGDCNVPAVHADIHALDWSPLNGRLYSSGDGGLYYTTNGGTSWTDISSGLAIAQVYKIGQSQTNEAIVINGYQDNGTATNNGSSFTTVIGGDGMECIIDYTNSSYRYGELYYGTILRTSGSGYLTIAGNGVNGINESGGWVTPYILHETNANVMFIGYKNVWRSTNVKASTPSWSMISSGETDDCQVIEQSPANVDILYVVRSGLLKRSDNANATTPTWTSCTLPGGYTPTDLEAHPTNANILYATAGYYVYKSTNKGAGWTNISGTLPAISINCIVYDESSNEGLYIGNQTGVFYKDITLSDWVIFNTGLPVVDVRELEIYKGTDYSNRRLKAATYGRGLWSSDLIETSVSDPCSSIVAIGGCGSSYSQTYTGGGSGFWFTSSSNPCGYITPGIEQIYSFVAPYTGTYSIQVTAASGYVDYLWKASSCSSSGWTCIDDIISTGEYGSMSWTAGTTYYILLDDENSTTGTHTFYINCPIICVTCPTYDFSISPTHSWLTHASSHVADGCKIYRVSVTSGYTYTFKTGCGNGATADYDTYLELYNSACTLLDSDDDDCESLRSVIEWTATYSGYCYLKVRGYGSNSGSYTLAYINNAVPVTRLLQNITIVNGQTVCYDAIQTITLAGSNTAFIVQNGGDITLIAGQNILMLPGTLVQSGGYMLAYITTTGLYCGALESAIVSIPPPEEEDQPNPNLTGQSFKIFPNPTTGQFTLLLDEPIGDQPCYLQVTGMLGNQIIRQRLEGSDHFEFDLSGQNPGIYIIRLITGDRIETKKLVKN